MSPGYMLMSIGMEYKPNDKFFLMLSPIGGKATFVMNELAFSCREFWGKGW